jgi:hypothetical protein
MTLNITNLIVISLWKYSGRCCGEEGEDRKDQVEGDGSGWSSVKLCRQEMRSMAVPLGSSSLG